MGSATIKGLIKFRIRRECYIATDGLSVVLCTDSINAYREGKGGGARLVAFRLLLELSHIYYSPD